MTDPSSNWSLTMSEDTSACISSPELPDGIMHSPSPDGPMADLFGQAVAPANRSRPPAKDKVAPTTGTYGRIGSVSSASADLQRSLANRLRQQLDGGGSTLFALTWRRKVTPRGRPYCQLAASARRTSEQDCGSWVSPTAQDHSRGTKPSRLWDTGIPLSQQVAMVS